MKITFNKSQYAALNDLRGLPEDAHMMLMCSRSTPTGGTLDGSEKVFKELVSFISEDLAYDMHSAATARTLSTVCLKIDPDCADWLGM